MTSTQLHQLRKEGKLQEALALVNHIPPDAEISLKVALAWLYYDLAKEAHREQNWKKVQNYYSAYMNLELPLSEELLHQQFSRFVHFQQAWSMYFEQADAASRENKHAEAIKLCREIAEQFPNFLSQDLYGWVLWRFMKDQTMEPHHANIKAINEVLDLYMELELHRPSCLHASMLRQVIKLVGKIQFNAYKFMYRWDWKNFRAEDLARYNDEKGLHFSLFEKAMHHYANVLTEMLWKYKNQATVLDQLLEDAENFMPLLEATIAERPDNPCMPKERDKLNAFLEGLIK